jgi:CNT family concentrative nucleoside transporter
MSDQGAGFGFGSLVDTATLSRLIVSARSNEWVQQADLTGEQIGMGFLFAFKVLPTIIFFSAFISVMYYLGVVQVVIRCVSWVMRETMGPSGSETLSCSGNIFVGQTEGPLLIRPYLDKMIQSELCAVMCGGFATIAGGCWRVISAWVCPANHLIIASVMSAPAALVMAKPLIPETESSETEGDVSLPDIKVGDNVLDAAANGTSDGLKLALNVGAMLISFIALIAVVNWIFGGIEYVVDHKLLGGGLMANGEYDGFFPGSLRTLFGTFFAPIAFVMGVP